MPLKLIGAEFHVPAALGLVESCLGKAEMEESTYLSSVACEILSLWQFQTLLVWQTKGIS